MASSKRYGGKMRAIGHGTSSNSPTSTRYYLHPYTRPWNRTIEKKEEKGEVGGVIVEIANFRRIIVYHWHRTKGRKAIPKATHP